MTDTETQLTTLAVMLHSSARHMSEARNEHGHVWSFKTMADAYTDALQGFYLIRNELAPHAEVYV